MTPLRRLWQLASTPTAFFERLAPHEPRVAPAFAWGALAVLLGSLSSAMALAGATASAPTPLLLLVPAAALGYYAIVWMLGGICLVRPAMLELRAWELSAWSWVPTGFLGVSLLPVALLAPVTALLVGVLLVAPWNLWLVWAGLSVYTPPRGSPRLAIAIYAGAVYLVPTAILLFLTLLFRSV